MNATEAQVNYLSTLFIDCGFTQTERKAFLTKRVGRAIVFLDQLTKQEASNVITELRDLKERKWAPTASEAEED